jgi:hypothetical protein
MNFDDDDKIQGLRIAEKEFMCLPVKRQMCLLYKNQLRVMELVEEYRLTQKIHYVMLTAALGGVGIIFTIILR